MPRLSSRLMPRRAMASEVHMANGGAITRVFISYSRKDTQFVDQLQASLTERGFKPWVDRQRLEAGQDWPARIQNEIENCQTMVVVLTPDAIESEWVRREFHEALELRRRVIPIVLKAIPRVPIALNLLQRVDFQGDYEAGLKDLLIALTRPDEPSAATAAAAEAGEGDISMSDAGVVEPPPLPTLRELYIAGVAARASGDIERAAILWEQILEREPDYLDGLVKSQLDEITPLLRPGRIQRLRDTAEAAQRHGEWGEEVSSWRALLVLDPDDEEAKTELPTAEQNRRQQEQYEIIKDLLKQGNTEAAKYQFGLLWARAPFYGDPEHRADGLGLRVPPIHIVHVAEERATAERIRLEQERQRQLARQEAEEAEHLRQLDLAAAAQRQREEEEEHVRQAQVVADNLARQAQIEKVQREQEAVRKARRARRPLYRSVKLKLDVATAWLCIVLVALSAGLGTAIVTRSWQYAGIAAAATAVVSYLLGSYRALAWPAWVAAVVVATAASVGVLNLNPGLISVPDTVLQVFHDPFSGVIHVHGNGWLFGRSLAMILGFGGLGLGAVFGLIGGIIEDGPGPFGGLAIGLLFGWIAFAGVGLVMGLTVGYLGWLLGAFVLGALAGLFMGLLSVGELHVGVTLGVGAITLLGLALVLGLVWTLAYGVRWDSVYLWAAGAAGGMLAASALGATLRIWFTRAFTVAQVREMLKPKP